MLEKWQAVVLGLVEGITEYLPVSSTGHLILAQSLLGLDQAESKSALDAFSIVIQGGAILAVLGLYASRVAQMLRGVVGRDAAGRRLLLNVLVAFLPAAILGPLLDDWLEAHLFRPLPVVGALFAGGVWMIWLDRGRGAGEPGRELALDALDWRRALAVGFLQCIAMWPGTSRSMMTIAGGTLVGLRPRDAAEFSFLVGVPTLGGACVYKLAKNLLGSARDGTPNLIDTLGAGSVVLGIAVATLSAALAVRWLVAFLNRHGLAAFGWYRIGLSVVMAIAFWFGWVRIV
ncbi:MAG: undecaprenyl-diphosphate phosphatase [Myxococcota bacterium]